ncbi:hypothetical protein ACHAWX_001715 [Stephanocyclus meneghinianus]
MTGYPLKLFRNRYGFNGRTAASVDGNKFSLKPIDLYSESSFQRCGSETSYSNADSLKSPADVTQADNIFDAVFDDRSHAVSSSDEETSECYAYVGNGLLITPIPRRHALFSPPKSMFDGSPKHVRHRIGKSKLVRKLLPWKRGYSAKSSGALHASIQVHSPYITKTALSKLSPALRNSDQIIGSPWKKPASLMLCSSSHFESDKNECTPPSVLDMEIIPSSSSDSVTLPLVISPACKFVPIGYESDDDCTFSSGDYEILAKSKSDLDCSDKYSPQLSESKSSISSTRSLPKSSEMKLVRSDLNSTCNYVNESITRVKTNNAEDDLTPFEVDQKAGTNYVAEDVTEACNPLGADQILTQAESSSSFDPSEEFTVVSFCESETAEPQNIDNDGGRKDEKQTHFNDWRYIWDRLALVMSCGTA